jgi:ornithine carbamoyltransferase
MAASPTKRDLLSINDIANDLPGLLDRALALKRSRAQGDLSPTRPGTQLALIFEKPSTRTRTSFEVAVSDLGGRAIYFSSKDMQLGRGETVADTARVLSRYVHAIAYRAFRHEDEVDLASHATIPVVNALDNHEHPCQIVADLLTLKERWPSGFHGKRLAYIGDGNNVLQSLLLGCAAVGLDLSAAIPSAYRPTRAVVEQATRLAGSSGAKIAFTEQPKEAAAGADALYTDVWVSMGDEDSTEERELAFRGYQINAELLRLASPSAWVLHDLPAHRGLEITDEVIDGPQSAVWDQAENRLHAQKAILELLLPAPTAPG